MPLLVVGHLLARLDLRGQLDQNLLTRISQHDHAQITVICLEQNPVSLGEIARMVGAGLRKGA
jgi:hypothetical protein